MARNYSHAMSTSYYLFPACNEISREISKWGTLLDLTLIKSIRLNGPSRAYQSTVRKAQQLHGCLRHRSALTRRQNDHEVAVRYTSRSRNHPQGETHVPASTDDGRRTSKQYSHSRTLRISRSRS